MIVQARGVEGVVQPNRPDPTPSQIRRACSQIQAGWSPADRAKRAGLADRTAWTAPVVNGVSDDGEPAGILTNRGD